MPRDIPEPYTLEMIADVRKALQQESDRLLFVEEYMRERGIEKLEVRNSVSFQTRGLAILTKFTQSAVEAARKSQFGTSEAKGKS